MKALCWHGTNDVRVDTVPDPKIADPGDAIVQDHVHRHLRLRPPPLDGLMPTMESGDVLGHEPMGVVVEVGRGVTKLKKGDRVVVPFTISCGELLVLPEAALLAVRHVQPQRGDRPQDDGPGAGRPVRLLPHDWAASPAARRSTCACPTPTSARSRFPTACPTKRSCSCPTSSRPATWPRRTPRIEPGDTVAVWGCGPVAQFAIRSAWMFKAGRVIAIDRGAGATEDGRGKGQGGDDQLRQAERLRPTDGDDQGPWAGSLHRRGRLRGALQAAASTP